MSEREALCESQGAEGDAPTPPLPRPPHWMVAPKGSITCSVPGLSPQWLAGNNRFWSPLKVAGDGPVHNFTALLPPQVCISYHIEK